MSPATVTAPTERQLRYLRVLAANTATSFTYPSTRAQASRQIDRLRKLEVQPSAPILERDGVDEEELFYATAVHASELSGWGSTCSWRTRPCTSPRFVNVHTAEPTELASYTVTGGQRVLRAQRVSGVLILTDDPSAPGGRSYVVEREVGWEADGALEALIADYLAQARELDEVPMASAAIRRMLGRPGGDA